MPRPLPGASAATRSASRPRRAPVALLALAASAALGSVAHAAAPRPAQDDAIRAVAERLRLNLEDAVARAVAAAPGGMPLRIAARRRGDQVVWTVRLLEGNGERVVEIDGESGEVRSSTALPPDADRQRQIAVLSPLLRTAEMGAAKAAGAAAAKVAGSRALLVEPEIENDALQFEVTLFSPRGVAKAEVDAATGEVRSLVGDSATAPFDPRRQTFDHVAPGTALEGWLFEAPGVDAPPSWSVTSDGSARSKPNVLALAGPAVQRGSRLVAWYRDLPLQDGLAEVSIRLDPAGGGAGGAGGLVWRLRDGLDHYALTIDGPARQLRLESLRNGTATTIATLPLAVAPDRWYALGVRHAGDRIELLLDGEPRLELRDSALPGAGAVGVWTSGEARARFDDLRIEPAGAGEAEAAPLPTPRPVGPASAAPR